MNRTNSIPTLVKATARVSSDPDWIDIECTFSDGQKFTAVQVSAEIPDFYLNVVDVLQSLII